MDRDHRRWWLCLIVAGVLVFSSASCVPQSPEARRYADRRYEDRGYEDDSVVFYDALAPYGRWVTHETYGRVWYPLDVPMGWRPYTDGHWEYSGEYGWVWASDREWGWAPFHYGRWAFDDWYGWVWVPGREWAPAWVVWRYGGGYAAWAPMPPTALWRPGQGVDRRYFRHDRDLDWDCWVGVPERHLHDREMRRYIIGQRDNARVINRATTVVSVIAVNGRVVNQGIPVGYYEKISGRPVRRVRLHEVERPDARDGDRTRDGLQVVRPHFRQQSPAGIRRESERAAAAQQERRESRAPQSRSEPRKAGRFAGKPDAPEVTSPGGRGASPAAPPFPAEARTVRQPVSERGGQPRGNMRVDEGDSPATPVAPLVVPQVTPQGKAGGRKFRGGEQLRSAVPVPPVIHSPSAPAPPEVQAVPKPELDPVSKQVPRRERELRRGFQPVAPAGDQESAPQEVPQEKPRPEGVGTTRGQLRGWGNQRVEPAPQQQVDPPVAPTLPVMPSFRRPQAPVRPEALPPQEAGSSRRGWAPDQRRRPEAQGSQEAVPGMAPGQQLEQKVQPSREEVAPDGRVKRRKKKFGQQEEEEESVEPGDLPPQPQP